MSSRDEPDPDLVGDARSDATVVAPLTDGRAVVDPEPPSTKGVESGTRRSPELGDEDTVAPIGGTETHTVPARPGRPNPSAGHATRRARRREGERLERVGLIARGGMGEILRVHDAALDRHLAMKVLHVQFNVEPRMRERFLEEAQITAQLTHPGIPPVHEIGELRDGRPYFTMKEVHGETLAALIAGLAEEGGHGAWSERRRLEIFQKVCEAVAYAHARGVVHGDLKPLNVMVGAFGEVLVMDWGVALLVDPVGDADEPPVATEAGTTRPEMVAGTPAYMPPEQAAGDVHRLGPGSDVYALGVMLYELLAGERPYQGTPPQLLFKSVEGAVPPIEARPGTIVDDALFAMILRAMAPEIDDRYPGAGPLAEELARWREGALRREKALSLVREAEAALREVEPLRTRSRALDAEARAALGALGPDARVHDKAEAWASEDEARELARRAELRTLEVTQLLQGALVHAPTLPEARTLLARIHHDRHRAAEARRDLDEAVRHELHLRAYDVGEHQGYLAGRAPLELVTDPPCRVRLLRYVERARRLVPEHVADLGETPLSATDLPIGSYLLDLFREDRPPVRYPALLDRVRGWEARRPGDAAGTPVPLPEKGALARGELYVPAGWFLAGGERDAPRWVWVDGFVIQERPVTMAELARFLSSPEGAAHRAHVLRDGLDVWRADWPAVGLSWRGAVAFAAWHAEQTQLGWRLPMELEWEKAARGVDGRAYPWGDFADGSFCHARAGTEIARAPVSVYAFPTDRSPYGMIGAGGNVRDWCFDPHHAAGPAIERGMPGASVETASNLRVARGGSWRQGLDAARCSARVGLPADVGFTDVAVRLVRSLGA